LAVIRPELEISGDRVSMSDSVIMHSPTAVFRSNVRIGDKNEAAGAAVAAAVAGE
jgi:hypothetical protein